MRKLISLASLAGIVSFLVLSSCEPSEPMMDARDHSSVNVRIIATATGESSAGFSSGRVMADSMGFSEASMGVSSLKFQVQGSDSVESDSTEVDSTDVDGEGARIEGPFTFDLIAGTSTPDFDAEFGPYKGIVVKLAPILDDGNSIFVSFELINDTDTTAVEFASNTKRAFVIKTDSLEIDGSASHVLVLLQIDKLFDGIDFTKATADEDGVIRISKDSNKKLHNKINSNLAKAFKAGKDKDDDGDIDE